MIYINNPTNIINLYIPYIETFWELKNILNMTRRWKLIWCNTNFKVSAHHNKSLSHVSNNRGGVKFLGISHMYLLMTRKNILTP